MAAGGFKFGQASATYNSSTYSTKRDWALAVHKARCDAFFLAQYGAGDEWACYTTGLYNEISESRTVGGNTYTLKIQDIHPLTDDTTGEYPAFITFWMINGQNTEYAIITSNGVNFNSSYSSDFTKGLYIPKDKLPCTGIWGDNYRFTYYSLAHSYGNAGFYSHDFSANGIRGEQLSVLPICGFDGNNENSSYVVNSSYGIIYNPTQGVTYSFGYAVRGTVIECFYRTSQYDANSGWNWSIIGEILSNPTSGYSTAYYSYYTSGGERSKIDNSYCPKYSGNLCAFSCIDNEENVFPPSNLSGGTRYSCLRPSYMPSRCNSTMPSELLFSAGCLAFCQSSGGHTTESYSGIDGNGNCVAGLIDTDILRIVPRQACTVGGAIYQGGNFVVPAKQINVYSCDDFGILLGWDPSNESIV